MKSRLLTFGNPSSSGVPADLAQHTLVLDYNDPAQLADAFSKHGDKIACVIVEAVAGNMNLIAPKPEFLKAMRVSGLLVTIESRQRAVDEIDNAGFAGTGSVIRGNDLCCDGFDFFGLLAGEKLKLVTCRIGDLGGVLVGGENCRPVGEHPCRTQAGCRTNQELTARAVVGTLHEQKFPE